MSNVFADEHAAQRLDKRGCLACMGKICTKCHIEKELSFFNKKRNKLTSQCKQCLSDGQKIYRAKNIELAKQRCRNFHEKNKEKSNLNRRIYHEKNKEKSNLKRKAYYEKNKEKTLILLAAYYKKNKATIIKRVVEYTREKRSTDYVFYLKSKIRRLVALAISNNGYTKKSRTHEILGCDYEAFVKHIESQFKDGMSWDNRNEWHIDHIIPLASAKTEDDVIRLNHYTNLQPLWAIDNLKKGAKYNE